MGTRERVYYLYDCQLQENVYKKPDLFEVQNDARKRNEDEGEKRYKAKGGWVIHKL